MLDETEFASEVLFSENIRETVTRLFLQLNMHKLVAFAIRNRVSSRLLKKILGFQGFLLQDKDWILREKLEECNRRSKIALNLVLNAQRALEDYKVHFVFFKTMEDYPDVEHDLDILVSRDDLPKAERALFNLNPFRCEKDKDTIRPRFLRFLGVPPEGGHFIFGPHDLFLEVELYTRLTNLGEKYISEDETLRRSRASVFNGVSVRVPSPEDSLLIMSAHVMYRHGGLIRFNDIYNVVQLLGRFSLDWTYILNSSCEMGTRIGLLYFLNFINNYYLRYLDRSLLPQSLSRSGYHASKIALSEVLRFPYRASLKTLFLIYTVKILSDALKFRWQSATKTLLASALRIIGNVLHKIFLHTHQYERMKQMGWR